LTAWLERVQPPYESEQTFAEPDNESVSNDPQREMQSSRASTLASKDVPSEDHTVTQGTPPKSRKLNWDKLRAREIRVKPSEDPRSPHFEALLCTKLPKLNAKEAKEVQKIFRAFINLSVKDVDYPQIESLSNEFDLWKSKVCLAKITEEHFLRDVARCTFSNEAVLQRTVMMEILDRHQLHHFLTFNSEGQWDQHKNDYLISKDSCPISLPKPDLNMSFQLESFDEMAAIPPSLQKSFRPDSAGQLYGRCFPFLFFEVKRATEKLELAEMANLNSASQALFNMYAWMGSAQQATEFFEKVRVFTFVFNAQDISVRIHRAMPHEVTGLQYHFVNALHLRSYSKTQVCLLLRKILEDYAIKELHPILKSAFDIVTKEYSRETWGKHRADFAQTTSAPRSKN
jgi:hypothetical protein